MIRFFVFLSLAVVLGVYRVCAGMASFDGAELLMFVFFVLAVVSVSTTKSSTKKRGSSHV